MRSFSVLPLLLLLTALSAACSPAETEKPVSPPSPPPALSETEERTIVAVGDSLTEGLGVDRDDAYPAQLERALRDRGYAVRVVNAGISGETSAGALSRASWILRADPDIVILATGANDGLRGLPVEQTDANMRTLVETLQAANVTVVYAGMIAPENLGAEYTAAFSAMYPAIAEEYSLPFIPFLLDGVVGDSTLNQADEIHPTADGYTVVVERSVLPVMLTVLNTE